MGVDEGTAAWSRPLPWDTSDTCSKLYKLGERGSGYKTETGQIQDFHELHRECLKSGKLFEDPEFPCNGWSAWGSTGQRNVQWLRPNDICEKPEFFVHGASRFDVLQGELGNCWMVASIACLTLRKELFNRVVPEQSFQENYAGIFHFRLWKDNRWLDVVVDDRLPCRTDGKLCFIRSRHENEFWSALLEKAYAKLNGSYGALTSGIPSEGMEDLTGGLSERIVLADPPKDLFSLMLKAHERRSLMSASIKNSKVPEERLDTNLISGHSYSITSVRVIKIGIELVRLRNPWGYDYKWNGRWSDQSPEWQSVPTSEKESMGLRFEADGEFWMCKEDFMEHFHFLDICYVAPDTLTNEDLTDTSGKGWDVSAFEGAWIPGATAGGCPNYIKSMDLFCTNPQYLMALKHPDAGHEECSVLISLMQRNRRYQAQDVNNIYTKVGFVIYKMDDPDDCSVPLDMSFFRKNRYITHSQFINYRQVTKRVSIQPGTYCIVPSTYEYDDHAEFLLRIFTEKYTTVSEYDQKFAFVESEVLLRQEVETYVDGCSFESYRRLHELLADVAGENSQVDAYELQQLFTAVFKTEASVPEGSCDEFPLELCRSMVALSDHNRSGSLDLKEFTSFWKLIRTWTQAFNKYDKDSSGSLGTYELREALLSAGYTISNPILQSLVLRYGTKKHQMTLNDFLACVIKLRAMIVCVSEIFKTKDRCNIGKAVFTTDEWLAFTMYC
ncbi:calpain-B-like isoform X4 [Ornithodoros turicata]|uniref:calpain-B-like isoform X4 n=1 Tax=Ornithodoros turicata TaxID=34597 RepID=UPI003138AD52